MREICLSDLEKAGVAKCSEKVLDWVRIENQTPWFGQDMDERNLPQELNRDNKAISFEKGCYLGQETVARIDAIGHVNQLLVGLQVFWREALPLPGTELTADDKVVGRITSVAADVVPLAWVIVRRAKAKSGVELEFAGRQGNR